MRVTTTAKLASALVMLVGVSYPVPYTAAPKWEVWVVDETGAPIGGMTVRLSYRNYSTESEGHELDATTDSLGYSHFPMQRSSASLGRYFTFSALSATAGVHASFGRYAYIFAFGKGLKADETTGSPLTNWTGEPAEMKSRLVARRRLGLGH